jgi:aminopeptidase S
MRRRGWLLGLFLVACANPASPSPTPTSPPIVTSAATASPTPSPTSAPTPEPSLDGGELAALVDAASLRSHLQALQRIADETPGRNRATGTSGFDGSVDHVVATLESAGYAVERRQFTDAGVSSVNVLAERAGTVAGVVMIGAHLDSVAAGPGINDNGSGVAAVLVIARALAGLPRPERTIRFAFWGAEEGGPFGSAAYVDGLSTAELEEIVAYLNFDMLGSPNAVRFVYDEDDAPPGSGALTALLGSAFDDAGLAWDRIDVDRRSDHGPFAAAGIPIGGLFSGGRELVAEQQAAAHDAIAGQPSDPCSDVACDTIDNVDLATLEEMARIIALVLVDLATTPD